MVDAAWHPAAAYFYVLYLDGPSLAWEYLRRNPQYRCDWRERRRRPQQAQRWGLRLLENPDLDARDAHPDWCPDPPGVVLVHPDADPPDIAQPFRLWALPGEKRLLHDGRRLLLTHRFATQTLRLSLSPELEEGAPHLLGVRAGAQRVLHWRCAGDALAQLDRMHADAHRAVIVCGRPGRTAMRHVATLQVLDGAQAGASQRQIAEVLFGVETVAVHWHRDGHLRSCARRLLHRGCRLMRGGYRRLLHSG